MYAIDICWRVGSKQLATVCSRCCRKGGRRGGRVRFVVTRKGGCYLYGGVFFVLFFVYTAGVWSARAAERTRT